MYFILLQFFRTQYYNKKALNIITSSDRQKIGFTDFY